MSRIIPATERIPYNWYPHARDCSLEKASPEERIGWRCRLTIAQLEKSMTSPNYKAAKPLWK